MHNRKERIAQKLFVGGRRSGRGLYKNENWHETNRFWSVLPLSRGFILFSKLNEKTRCRFVFLSFAAKYPELSMVIVMFEAILECSFSLIQMTKIGPHKNIKKKIFCFIILLANTRSLSSYILIFIKI